MKRSLSKNELLRRKKEIKGLFFSSRQYSCRGMKLFLVTGATPLTRVLVTLSRGYGTAVERNYAKRVGKEIFRNNKHLVQGGLDLGFLFYPGDYDFKDRESQMLGLLKKAHILSRNG